MHIRQWTMAAVLVLAIPVAGPGQTATFALRDATITELEQLGLRNAGALVVESAPVALAGAFRTGDVLAFADAKALVTLADLAFAVEAAKGGNVDILFYRDGLPDTVSVRLTPAMIPSVTGAAAKQQTTDRLPGRATPDAGPEQSAAFALRDATIAELEQLGLRNAGALVVESAPDALGGAFSAGDVLAFAGAKALVTLADLASAVEAAKGGNVDILFYRDGLPDTVSVRLTPAMVPSATGAAAKPAPGTGGATPEHDTGTRQPTVAVVRELDRLEETDRGETPEVQALLALGSDPNSRDSVFGRTAIMWAIRKPDPRAFERLLVTGADVNAIDNEGMTPLMHVFDPEGSRMSEAVIWALLGNGADARAIDKSGRSVLTFAIQSGSTAGVHALLDSGADANRRPVAGQLPPLGLAAALGHVDIVGALLAKGATVDGTDAFRRTPLMMAADNGEVEVVRLLAARGADLNATDDQGRTALAIAGMRRQEPPIPFFQRKQEGRARVAELLRQLGAR